MTIAYIPYGAYWSTPFAKWQGSLAHLHSLRFAAHVALEALSKRGIATSELDYGVLGITTPQYGAFWGMPWVGSLMGAPELTGPTVSQACATGAQTILLAADAIALGRVRSVLALTADRISNTPHIYYPEASGIAGSGTSEDWQVTNFREDPFLHIDMTQTAENCAVRWKIDTSEQHEVSIRRYDQYRAALDDTAGCSFHSRYMTLPFDVPDRTFKRTIGTLLDDEGIRPVTAEGVAHLKPVKPGGTVTNASQTHPADGNAGILITDGNRAKELSARPEIAIHIVAGASSRAEAGFMPHAPVLAARKALDRAGIGISDCAAIKSHNPFVVNDIVFAREFDIDVMAINNYGSPLIYGHPQAPTGMRCIIELVEELVALGGGYGLFQGCAAGDSATAIVVKVQ
jgi:acetyl-CoA acetyltransferase